MCLCACVSVRVTSCVELPVNVPETPLEAQESPVREGTTARVCHGSENTHGKKRLASCTSVFVSCHASLKR